MAFDLVEAGSQDELACDGARGVVAHAGGHGATWNFGGLRIAEQAYSTKGSGKSGKGQSRTTSPRGSGRGFACNEDSGLPR